MLLSVVGAGSSALLGAAVRPPVWRAGLVPEREANFREEIMDPDGRPPARPADSVHQASDLRGAELDGASQIGMRPTPALKRLPERRESRRGECPEVGSAFGERTSHLPSDYYLKGVKSTGMLTPGVDAPYLPVVPGEIDEPTPQTFGARLARAIELSGKTQTRTERECELGQGRIHRLLGKGKNPILSPGPELIRVLADYLGVTYEWLAIGRGRMRPAGWAPSPLEEAMTFAVRHGARRDAIDAAIERHRETPDMTGNDWVLAFDVEARRLDKMGVPRPEVVQAAQRQTRRLAKKRAEQLAELADLSATLERRRQRQRQRPAQSPQPPKTQAPKTK